ncbi:MAG: ribonuclease E/G, partial [Pseudomonadota bacterium]
DVLLGRVTRLEPALGLAFCDLGSGPAGVLPLDQAPKGMTEGQALPLRIVRAAAPGKGPKLSRAKGPAAWQQGPVPRLLQRGENLLARFLTPPPALILLDMPEGVADLKQQGFRTEVAVGGFSGSLASYLEGEVEALLQPQVALPGGGSLIIEPGETLTAIDVNMGAGGEGRSKEAALAFNLAALPEVAREIRLRSLAGRILIDCLALQHGRARQALRDAMAQALADDSETTRLNGMTESGLLEITRRRGLFQPLHELLTEPVGTFSGRSLTLQATAAALLRQLAAEQRARPTQRFALIVTPSLLALLEQQDDWPALRGRVEVTLNEPQERAPYHLRALR